MLGSLLLSFGMKKRKFGFDRRKITGNLINKSKYSKRKKGMTWPSRGVPREDRIHGKPCFLSVRRYRLIKKEVFL